MSHYVWRFGGDTPDADTIMGWAEFDPSAPTLHNDTAFGDRDQRFIALCLPADVAVDLANLIRACDKLAILVDASDESPFVGWTHVAEALTQAARDAETARGPVES